MRAKTSNCLASFLPTSLMSSHGKEKLNAGNG